MRTACRALQNGLTIKLYGDILIYMKKITIVTGHFGSGKTEFAVNYAMRLKKNHEFVNIVDMDTVNPYFRTGDAREALHKAGIRLISPLFANTNVDITAIPGGIMAVFDGETSVSVLDVGGDDDGAVVLGTYEKQIKQAGYEMFFVFNACRPMTADADSALSMLRKIEQASRLHVTGIVNNTNLMEDTTAETILTGHIKTAELSKTAGIPVKYLTATNDNIMELNLYLKETVKWQE